MTTKVIYISDDGEEFETEDECLEYEKRVNPSGAVLLFDEDKKLNTERALRLNKEMEEQGT